MFCCDVRCCVVLCAGLCCALGCAVLGCAGLRCDVLCCVVLWCKFQCPSTCIRRWGKNTSSRYTTRASWLRLLSCYLYSLLPAVSTLMMLRPSLDLSQTPIASLAYRRRVRVPPDGGGPVCPAHVSLGLQGLQDACAGVFTSFASLTPR